MREIINITVLFIIEASLVFGFALSIYKMVKQSIEGRNRTNGAYRGWKKRRTVTHQVRIVTKQIRNIPVTMNGRNEGYIQLQEVI